MKVNFKKKNGFSLIEVVVSFVLISIISVFILGVVTSAFRMSAMLNDLPNIYYNDQDVFETNIAELKDDISKKYQYKNILDNVVGNEYNDALEKYNEIENDISNKYHTKEETVSLFGKNIQFYSFNNEDLDNGTKYKLRLFGGVINTELVSRPVPIISSVVVDQLGDQQVANVSNAAVVNATITYDNKNLDYKYSEVYQWYVSTQDIDQYDWDTNVLSYPDSFVAITGNIEKQIKLDESLSGKYICCVVTPISINAKMGAPTPSNFIKVYD